jgi:hypothetical protein
MPRIVGCLCAIVLILTPVTAGAAGTPDRAVVSVLNVSGDWETAGDLPWQALLLSLQGVANLHGPNIYLTYPADYVHPDVAAVLQYYRDRHAFKTRDLSSVEEALELYRHHVKGYVLWDTLVRPTLMVAFTVAGLEEAVVVTERHLSLMQKLGLRPVADLRMKFRGKADIEIFRWAYDQYWARCSRDYLVYLGEHCTGLKGGPGMRPGIADFAIAKKAFCTDLSAHPAHDAEFQLAGKIMSEMKPLSHIFGWHSYCKDKEEEHITLLSQHALVMAEGLATLPNMSFHGQVPVSPDFTFRQKGAFNPEVKLEKKVYVTLIQSDGMGIGSWLKPGRGEIPYGWEVNEEYYNVAPALLQYYYESALPNDTFIGSLSGPGYFYPKAYPPERLAQALRREDTLMRKMDLHVFGIMDFSEGDHAVGNADLPERVVDAYYANLPSAIGFVNGYGPANTYAWRDGRALISYNYYVDLAKPAEEVAEDLQELATLNPKRPCFIPVHVRENNDVRRMREVVQRLGPEFVILPPREFMILAGKQPSVTTRYLEERPDFSGQWKLVPGRSRNVFPATLELEIDQRGSVLSMTTSAIEPRYIHHREMKTTRTMVIGGPGVPSQEEMTRRLGYSAGWSDSVVTSARWKEDGQTLMLTTQLRLQTSQGVSPSTSTSEYVLSDGGMTLTVTERRSTRPTTAPVGVYVYRRVLR